MQVWILETFANKELNRLFWLATASSAPIWIMMLFFPRAKISRQVCQLWTAPPVLGLFYLYLLHLAYDVTGLPTLDDVEMKSVRRFWGHPILFIALWMHRLAMDLFVGIWIFRFGRFRGWNVSIELLLVWLAGPLGAFVFAIRYWIALIRTKIGKRK